MPAPNIKIFVLSLKDAQDRRMAVTQQFDSLPQVIKWEFFDAVKSEIILNNIDWIEASKNSLSTIGRRITTGEMACAESHYQIWKRVASSSLEWAVILEDDFILKSKFIKFLNLINKIPTSLFDVVLLGYSKIPERGEKRIYSIQKVLSILKLQEFSIGKAWNESTCGTVGYIISKQACLNIIRLPRLYTLADDWGNIKKYYSVNIGHLRPFVILENFECFESSLEAERSMNIRPFVAFLDPIRYIRSYFRWLLMLLGVKNYKL